MDHLGTRVEGRTLISFGRRPARRPGGPPTAGSGTTPPLPEAPPTRAFHEGTAVFPFVGLGEVLEYGVIFPDAKGYQSGHAHGPSRPGETVRIRVQADPPAPFLTGRFLLTAGSFSTERPRVRGNRAPVGRWRDIGPRRPGGRWRLRDPLLPQDLAIGGRLRDLLLARESRGARGAADGRLPLAGTAARRRKGPR